MSITNDVVADYWRKELNAAHATLDEIGVARKTKDGEQLTISQRCELARKEFFDLSHRAHAVYLKVLELKRADATCGRC